MCGLCGQYHFVSQQPVNPVTLRAMTATLSHRGPDDEGYFISGAVGFGFRRLAIIDLAGGHQPMSDPDQSVCLVFNGEIYNFPELRRELAGLGHVFRTHSDTEVILHGYRQWHTGVFARLNGMFGVAIWEAQQKRLVLARDALGIKPLYYRVDGESVLFGSEIRAITAALSQRPAVDPLALNLFLRYRYTPSPLTLYQGIRKLAPGTLAVFDREGYRTELWYRYRPTLFSASKPDADIKEELLALYQQALKRHLLSDVPVGLLLSGGIDSGLLLALMSRYGQDWPTYTVGYGQDYRDDELADAAVTARWFAARHTPVTLDRPLFEQTLPQIVSALEEPVAASSIVPMYFVCQRARQDVKVALIGQGPDELFGGYTRHLGVHYGAYWRRLPGWMRAGLTAGIQRLPRHEALKRGACSLGIAEPMQRYQQVFSLLAAAQVDRLFRPGLLPAAAGDSIRQCWQMWEPLLQTTDELGAFQVLELRSSLPDELLMYADKLSMAHGLEVRVPYLDRELVEYVGCLPARYKIRYGQRKWMHRKISESLLPPALRNRKKRGFAVNVVDDWFRHSLTSGMDSYLCDSTSLMFAYLQPQAVRELLEQHRTGQCDNHKILFSLIVFEEWLRSQATVQDQRLTG